MNNQLNNLIEALTTNLKTRYRSRMSCLVILLAMSGTAYSANITVTDFGDANAVDGSCTLREAIQAANTDTVVDACTKGSATDTIVLSAGNYTLDLASGNDEDANANGDLDITSDMEIRGAGAAYTIIDGVSGQSKERVLHVHANIVVAMHDLTVQGGNAANGLVGGNILNLSNGSMIPGLRLSDVIVSFGNALIQGGGFFNSGKMQMIHCSIKNYVAHWIESSYGTYSSKLVVFQ